jgi:hypothetical protein
MSYQVAIASSRGDDATMAKSFIITLEGTTLTWYTRLPPLSIYSWKGLRDKFLLNFQGYRPDIDVLAELSLSKQQEKETLREYYTKFLSLKSQLPSVDDHIAIHYAISALQADVLYSRCIRDPPKSLQELYQLFEKYAGSEEPKDPPQSSRTWTRLAQPDSGRDNRNHQKVHNIANQHPAGETTRRQEYHPHDRGNDTRGRGRGRTQQPRRFYCLFHGEDCAHPTRDCVNHVALTGPVVQKKWSHVPLTFDAKVVDLPSAPHVDAMVINYSVAGWDLHKVLVDNGSQADIIILHAFDRMGISHNLLKPSDNPLYGFSGKGTFPIDKIELPLSFGVAPNARSE